MVENTLDKVTEAWGVEGRRLRARRGAFGDHELVTAPKYYGKLLVDKNNGRGSSSHTRSKYANTELSIVFFYKDILQIQ